jgi:HEPN domain-containing protein
MPDKTVDAMLKDKFEAKHADAAIRHFTRMVQDFQQREWEDANAKAGRFVEAVLKAVWHETGKSVPKGKDFKAGNIMDLLAHENTLSHSLRFTIPRACRFIYEIASNRGARHDADEVAANEMDANAVTALCSWVLAEMVSHSQKGMDLDEAKAAVDALMKRKYPFMENIDGRVYVDIANSAREAALLILHGIFPRRMSEESLARQVARHGYSKANSEMGVKRIRKKVDNDDHGNLRLRNLGVREAEALIEKAEQKAT